MSLINKESGPVTTVLSTSEIQVPNKSNLRVINANLNLKCMLKRLKNR